MKRTGCEWGLEISRDAEIGTRGLLEFQHKSHIGPIWVERRTVTNLPPGTNAVDQDRFKIVEA